MAQPFHRRLDLVKHTLTDVSETQTTGYHESLCKAKQKPVQVNIDNNALCISCGFKHNKAIVDIRLRPRSAIPPPPSGPIGCSACARNFYEHYLRLAGILNDPFWCMALLASEWSIFQQTRHCSKDANVFDWPEQPPKLPPQVNYML